MEKKLSVSAIKDGSVIDHITAGQALNIIKILNLTAYKKIVTVGINLPSKAAGIKDLIKIEGKEISRDEASRFAFLAPLATINIIHNYQVAEKYNVEMPKTVDSLIICPNHQCITNHQPISSTFLVLKQNKSIQLQCQYCEKIFHREDINKYNN